MLIDSNPDSSKRRKDDENNDWITVQSKKKFLLILQPQMMNLKLKSKDSPLLYRDHKKSGQLDNCTKIL